jgi:iron complex outermembrane recepter protein
MNDIMIHTRFLAALAGVSLLALASPAVAQDQPANEPVQPPVNEDDATAGTTGEFIIVQARRRDESQQDVPLVVNAVTAETIDKLNLREFEEIENLVPGLQLGSSANGIGVQANLRGVAYDVNASGNNGTIEFYFNDAPLSAGILFQSMFDVGQIEVLRGPQGTLRGRASPSGSITVTSRRPDLEEAGGYATGTINDTGGWNGNGALNIPIVAGVLGLRIAGVADENEGNQVRSVNNPIDPFVKTVGGRVSLLAEPADWLTLFGSYNVTQRKAQQFGQVESLSVTVPGAPAGPRTITAFERLGVQFPASQFQQDFQVFNWQAQARFGGQKLDYVGSHNRQRYFTVDPNDDGAFFGPNYPAALRNAAQTTNTRSTQTTHELRLSNEERVAGMIDYVIGGLLNKSNSPTNLVAQNALFAGFFIPQAAFPNFITTNGVIPAGIPLGIGFAANTDVPIFRPATNEERSVFGNLTAHIGEATEVSGGIRFIDYSATSSLSIFGVLQPGAEDRNVNHTIYSASIKHNFTPDIMAYASFGTSWRPGSSTNPIIFRDLRNPSPLLASFYQPGDETSKSYEIGFKSQLFDRRVRFNVTAYHQDFENYAYSVPKVYVAANNSQSVRSVFLASPAIAVGVPARVQGIEAEFAARPTDNWDLSATVSYSKSKIKNGVVPCNVYGGVVPTVAQIDAATGGTGIATCNVDYSAGFTPPFAATLQSEYLLPISPNIDGYVRGLFNFQGNSDNDPANPFDDVDSYGLLNLFAGVRDPDGRWELGGFVKNLFETERVLTRGASPLGVSYTQLFCTTLDPRVAGPCAGVLPPGVTTQTFGQTAASTYRLITTTPPREFGVTLRLQFGSR